MDEFAVVENYHGELPDGEKSKPQTQMSQEVPFQRRTAGVLGVKTSVHEPGLKLRCTYSKTFTKR